MREATHSTVVRAPADILWDYVADYSNLVRLASKDGRCELIAGEVGTVGAHYRVSIPWQGLESRYEADLTEAEWPERLTWTADAPSAFCSMQLLLERIDRDQMRVTATVRYESSPCATPLEPFAWGLLDRFYKRTMDGLHRLELPKASV